MPSYRHILKTVFGFSSFRPHQEEIIDAILRGRDLFAVLPTGGGKSLCYQLPAMLLPSLTVVISPLIALMEDQVFAARQQGIPAACLNSSLSAEEAKDTYRDIHRGECRLLYVSPERLALPAFRENLRGWGVSLFAVDEAHCISEWGHEFRPEYRNLPLLKDEFPDAVFAAFTATATPAVQDDVVSSLRLTEPLVVCSSFDRPEIFYRVRRKTKVQDQILSFIRSHENQAGIVYRSTRKAVEETARHLSAHGVSALPYHAGLPDATRRSNQLAFVRDEADVVVATIAFGMGIDKSNVRWVVHGDLPRSIEAYYQETGRAGRDGEDADTCLFYGPGDVAKIRYHIERTESPEEREQAERNLRAVLRFVDSGVCRRMGLLNHFEEEHPGNCGRCDVCRAETDRVDRTVEAQKALSAIIRTGERFGAHYIANVITGVSDERMERFGHHEIPTFGVGADVDRSDWLSLLRDLETGGYLRRKDGLRSGLRLTASGKNLVNGRIRFTSSLMNASTGTPTTGTRSAITRSAITRSASTSSATKGDRPSPDGKSVWREDQEALFQCLRVLRRRLAGDAGVPPYVIFSDRTLKEVVRNRPETLQALLGVHGIGETKAERYGSVLLKTVHEFLTTGDCFP